MHASTDLFQYIPTLRDELLDTSVPLSDRYRILFTLKNLPCDAAVEAMGAAFQDPSELFKHEVAYCLGQMGNARARDILQSVLLNTSQEPIVRHEAAEALAALDSIEYGPLLEELSSCDCIEVAETCQIAVRRIRFTPEPPENSLPNPFGSIDPAPPCADDTVATLTAKMMDLSTDLFDRYRALFALRNKFNNASALAVCEGFKEPHSALFRHEIAYVLGQLANPVTAPHLIRVLEDLSEHPMVRHEAAEALGNIITDEIYDVLTKFTSDAAQIVRESCIVALDMYEAEKNNDFQYANGIDRILEKKNLLANELQL